MCFCGRLGLALPSWGRFSGRKKIKISQTGDAGDARNNTQNSPHLFCREMTTMAAFYIDISVFFTHSYSQFHCQFYLVLFYAAHTEQSIIIAAMTTIKRQIRFSNQGGIIILKLFIMQDETEMLYSEPLLFFKNYDNNSLSLLGRTVALNLCKTSCLL